jgi:hypothetical protein
MGILFLVLGNGLAEIWRYLSRWLKFIAKITMEAFLDYEKRLRCVSLPRRLIVTCQLRRQLPVAPHTAM